MTFNGTSRGAPSIPKPSHARIEGGAFVLPDGRRLGDIPPAKLRALLHKLEIPHPPDAGLQGLADAYMGAIMDISLQASETAIRSWWASRMKASAPQ